MERESRLSTGSDSLKGKRNVSRSGTRDRRVRTTIYTWKSKYGWMGGLRAQRLKSLEDENRRLKHLVADLSLDKEVRAKTVGLIHEVGCRVRHRVVSGDQTLVRASFSWNSIAAAIAMNQDRWRSRAPIRD
jgi:hypothetical protein